MFGSVDSIKAMVAGGEAREAKAKEWLRANGYKEDDMVGKLNYLFETYPTVFYWANCGKDNYFREIRGTNKPFNQCSFDEDDKAIELKSIEQAEQYLSPNLYTVNKFGHYVDLATN